MTKTEEIQAELEAYIDPVKREYLPKFSRRGGESMAKATAFWASSFPTCASWPAVIRMNPLKWLPRCSRASGTSAASAPC